MRFLLGISWLLLGGAAVCVSPAYAGDTSTRPNPTPLPEPLELTQVAPGVFYHAGQQTEANAQNHGDIANVGFIIGDRCVAVVDTGGSPRVGAALLAAVRQETSRPICYVINTHMHPDHVLGNRAFQDTEAVFVAGSHFPSALASRAPTYLDRMKTLLDQSVDSSWVVLPDKTVETTMTLDLGERSLRLKAWPTAHTDNDVTVYDANTHTLWLGDLLFTNRVPSLDGSLTGWLAVLDRLYARDDVNHAIPGHGPVDEEWKEDLEKEKHYFMALKSGVQDMLDQGHGLDYAVSHVAVDQQSDWLLFEAYNARNVTAAYTELEWQ